MFITLNFRCEQLSRFITSHVTCHSSLCVARSSHEVAAQLEHVAHPRQGHDAGKSCPFPAPPPRLPLPVTRPYSDNRNGWPQRGTKNTKGGASSLSRSAEIPASRLGGFPPVQASRRHLRPRLFLASASRLQKLYDAHASSYMVAEETQWQRRPRQAVSAHVAQTRLASAGDLGVPSRKTKGVGLSQPKTFETDTLTYPIACQELGRSIWQLQVCAGKWRHTTHSFACPTNGLLQNHPRPVDEWIPATNPRPISQ